MILARGKHRAWAAAVVLDRFRFYGIQRPRRKWDDEEKERFLSTLQEQLGISSTEDWLSVSRKDVLRAGGRGLLRRHGDSWRRVLNSRFSGLGISEADCVKALPRGYWDDIDNCRSFLESAASQLGLGSVREWATVPRTKLAAMGGRSLVTKYGCMAALLQAVYPDEDWSHAPLPSSHWDRRENRFKRMREIGRALGVSEPTDWKDVTRADVQRMGGGAILSRYDSFFDALVDCCLPESTGPEEILLFRPQAPAGYWGNPTNVRQLLDRARKVYHVRVPSDWYRVSRAQIEALPRGKSLLSRMNLVEALRLAYPGEQWNEHACRRSDKRASQRWLHNVAQGIYRGCEVLEDVRLDQVMGAGTSTRLELDVYIPEKKLALEYQGRHHYEHLPFFGPVEEYARRDKEKSSLCAAAGIRLVEIPYWWDNELESLLGSLYAADPALIPSHLTASAEVATPIAAQPPQPSRASARSSARGSLMCPTYDGVRARWTGSCIVSTAGRRFDAPQWWLDSLPSAFELEGELYIHGKPGGGLGVVTSLIRQGSANETWASVKFHALDVIDVSTPLEKRLSRLDQVPTNSVVHVSPVELCRGGLHVAEALDNAATAGAAGILLRDPKSFSRLTGSPLWKERTVFRATATMVTASPSSRYLLVEQDGQVQAVRCSQQQYESPPAAGSIVNVVHYGKWGSGRLRYPFLA